MLKAFSPPVSWKYKLDPGVRGLFPSHVPLILPALYPASFLMAFNRRGSQSTEKQIAYSQA